MYHSTSATASARPALFSALHTYLPASLTAMPRNCSVSPRCATDRGSAAAPSRAQLTETGWSPWGPIR